jgi:hypothetical protein
VKVLERLLEPKPADPVIRNENRRTRNRGVLRKVEAPLSTMLLKAVQSEAMLIRRRLAYRRSTGQDDYGVTHTTQWGKFLQCPTIEILNRTRRYEPSIKR